MVKLSLCLIGVALVVLLSGCVAYYTKLYTLDEPPDDLFADLKVIDDFHGWSFYLGVTCAYRSTRDVDAELDSFMVCITAEPASKANLSEDSLWIDSASVTLDDGRVVTSLKEHNRRKSVRPPSVYTYYNQIQIPQSNDSVNIHFTVHLVKSAVEQHSREWTGTLYRYEKKVRGLPLD